LKPQNVWRENFGAKWVTLTLTVSFSDGYLRGKKGEGEKLYLYI